MGEKIRTVWETVKIILGFAMFFFMLILFCVLVSCVAMQFVPQPTILEIINENWGLSNPLSEKVDCEYKFSDFGLSDGERYCVFDWENRETACFSVFQTEKNVDFEESFSEMIVSWVDRDQPVPVEYRPDWTEKYLWKYAWRNARGTQYGYDFPAPADEKFVETLYMAYFPDLQRLYTFELYW